MMTPKLQDLLHQANLAGAGMEDIERRVILHQMYASVGRMNDAIAAGDKSGYEKEVNKQVELHGRFLCS